jgi:hypothetical protein
VEALVGVDRLVALVTALAGLVIHPQFLPQRFRDMQEEMA